MFQPAEDVLGIWPAIEPGIRKIKERCDAPWHESQIKAHLLDGRATVFLADFGFLILERCREPITAEPYLNVWMMWSKPRQAYKVREQIVLWLDAMQKHTRTAWWQFGSPREEWAEVIKPYCKKVMTIWRRM